MEMKPNTTGIRPQGAMSDFCTSHLVVFFSQVPSIFSAYNGVPEKLEVAEVAEVSEFTP